jgi:hypothetical protein
MRMEPTNNGTSVKSREGFWMGLPKWRQWFYRECGENRALCSGGLCRPLVASVPLPLFTSDKWEASLVGGNRGVQKCDSIDPLSLVIKCLGGRGDLIVLIINKRPPPSGGQVNTHIHMTSDVFGLTNTKHLRRNAVLHGK